MNETIILRPEPEAIKSARDHVAMIAGALHFDDFLPRLIVSELATNAWRQSAPDDHIVVRAYPWREHLVIEVWDQSDKIPVIQFPGGMEEGGRGLMIISELVVRWGTRPVAEGGKIVFAEIGK
ncbi:ATP-binding protein [Actinomadura fulvescens]|uniref:Histidine kinase/HSP90-like ATPase domain-containing protein n=1 Tax=Actinomadura fulvescens TaxID=46160 RepID=A0ABP6CSP0_9ACTN